MNRYIVNAVNKFDVENLLTPNMNLGFIPDKFEFKSSNILYSVDQLSN